jgi:hypothetical protein
MVLHSMVMSMMQQSTNDRARGETTTSIKYSSCGWRLTGAKKVRNRHLKMSKIRDVSITI